NWRTTIYNINNKTQYISTLLNSYEFNQSTSNFIRNKIRTMLHREHPDTFPYGQTGTSIVCVAISIFDNLHSRPLSDLNTFPVVHEHVTSSNNNSTSLFINNRFLYYINSHSQLQTQISVDNILPPILIVAFSDIYITINKEFIVHNFKKYKLIGIVY